MFKLSVIVLYFYLFNVIRTNIQEDMKTVLDGLLHPDVYDPEIKPGGGNDTDTPTTVSINLHVLSVSQIDDLKMLYTLEMYFRQEWKDERLQFDGANQIEYISLSNNHRIWVPDIFFPNEHKSYFHDIMESNTFLKINQNGTVFSSARITLVLRCNMHFAKYPFDRHICPLTIESYKWKAHEMFLQWTDVRVTISDEVLSPLFTLDDYSLDSGLIAMASGEYSILNLKFHFSRQIRYYIVHLYFPCCMIFSVACLACWLNSRLITARILIGLSSLFSCSMLTFNFNQDAPKVPYTRAIDIFTGMCLSFIFSTLIQTVFVHISESKSTKTIAAEVRDTKDDRDDIEQNEKVLHRQNTIKQMKKWLYENHQSLNDIDAASRVLFPICFLIFIAIYSITSAALREV